MFHKYIKFGKTKLLLIVLFFTFVLALAIKVVDNIITVANNKNAAFLVEFNNLFFIINLLKFCFAEIIFYSTL